MEIDLEAIRQAAMMAAVLISTEFVKESAKQVYRELYDLVTGERPPIRVEQGEAEVVDSALRFQPLEIAARPGDLPNPLSYRMDNYAFSTQPLPLYPPHLVKASTPCSQSRISHIRRGASTNTGRCATRLWRKPGNGNGQKKHCGRVKSDTGPCSKAPATRSLSTTWTDGFWRSIR